VFSKKNS